MPRKSPRLLRAVILGAAGIAAAAISSMQIDVAFFDFGGEPAKPKAKPDRFCLRVCDRCLKTKKVGSFNSKPILQEMRTRCRENGERAPLIEYGGCTGNCDDGPNVRLVRGEYAIPQIVEGMTEEEEISKAFLTVDSMTEEEEISKAFLT